VKCGHGQRSSGADGDPDDGDLAQAEPAAQTGKSNGELRRRGPSAERCSAISGPGGNKNRLAGSEEGFLSESAARRHVPTVQDQYGSAAATLDAVLDRVTVDGGRSGGRSLAHGSDSAYRNTISRWVDRIRARDVRAADLQEPTKRIMSRADFSDTFLSASVAISPSRRRLSLSPRCWRGSRCR
jgi:hypothetical protein